MMNLRICFLMLIAGLLSGCVRQEKNREYYMLHPLELRQEATQCDTNDHLPKSRCEMIESTFTFMAEIVSRQQENPQAFGQEVMNAETRMMQLHSEMIKADETVNSLRKNNASSNELKLAENTLQNAKQAFEQQQKKIRIYLAVIGMSSPD